MTFRAAVSADLQEICRIEGLPEYSAFIERSSHEDHAAMLLDPDARHLVAIDEQSGLVGYAILRGLTSQHRSVLLQRIAVGVPGAGAGRLLLAEVLRFAFVEHGAHRVWLDVFETNLRARKLYTSFGFQVEGMWRESVYRDEQFHSQVLMSLLAREYRALSLPSSHYVRT